MYSSTSDPLWAKLPEQFDSQVKQHCYEDLKAYYTYLQAQLNDLPPGNPQRLSVMAEMNGVLGAVKSLRDAGDAEVGESHRLFLEQAAQRGYQPSTKQ